MLIFFHLKDFIIAFTTFKNCIQNKWKHYFVPNVGALQHALFSLFNKAMYPCEKPTVCIQYTFLSECPWECVFPPSVLSLSLSLSAALADQHTKAVSLVQALSHTAVFFFDVWPCCLPLWCRTLFLRVNTLHFTCRTVQMDGREHACVPIPSAHYLHTPSSPKLKWSRSLL